MNSLKNKIERKWLLSRKRVQQKISPCESGRRRRVFVAGVQRSGTNMLMDVLEENLDTDVYHERDKRAFVDYKMRDQNVIQQLIDRSPACVFVIKALCELQSLGALMNEFQPSKTIWIIRDYNDVVNSMTRSFRNISKRVHRLAKDRDACGWLGEGMSNEAHNTLKSVVTDDLDESTAAALQWWFRNILYFEQGFHSDERVLLVKYEQIVTEPNNEFKKLFDFIGLEYSPHVSRSVTSRSIRKNRRPLISAPVQTLCDNLLAEFHERSSD